VTARSVFKPDAAGIAMDGRTDGPLSRRRRRRRRHRGWSAGARCIAGGVTA